jgi:hypothetical protein
MSRVVLVQLVRFLVIKLIHSSLNFRFDIRVIFTTNYSFTRRRRPLIDSEMFLVTDFVNLKIKPAQYFEGAHKDRVCVRIFIWVSAHTYMSICICTVLKKIQ